MVKHTDLPNPPSGATWTMGPAVMVGGRRRRSARRSNASRSNTMPRFGLESLAGTENASDVTAGPYTVQGEHSHVSPSFESPNSMVDHSQPNSGLPADHRPSPISRPFDGSSGHPVTHSPTPTTGSASTTATESKKKHGRFGFKSKDQDRFGSSHEPAHQLSPLPPLTPVKAAQLLGVDAGLGRARSNSEGRRSQHDGGNDGPPVWGTSMWQASTPALATSKSASSKQTKFTEQDIEPDPPKAKSFWQSSNRKAQRMLGLLPSTAFSSKREAEMKRTAAVPPVKHREDNTDTYYSSESELHVHPRLLHPAERQSSEVPGRRMRKKIPKSLDRMAPITETSHDELRSSYQTSEQNAELGVNAKYELEEDDLSPTDQVIEEESVEAEEDFPTHPGNEVDVKDIGIQQPVVFRLRGPLQTVEDRLLDEAEARLAVSRAKQNENDATRLILDTNYAVLKASNETMKMEFARAKQGFAREECECFDGADSEDDEDLISICSSIDMGEEPTVHVAKVIPFTRITPGMVKLVDIPPRKKKPAAPAIPLPMPALPTPMKPPFKPAETFFFQHDERISPFNERSEHVEPTVMPGHLTARNYSRLDKDKKPKMPRNDSQLLVQDWMSTFDHTKQRPISERIDLDVLADQQIPPAPLSKDDHPVTPHPRRSPSREHYCLKNGHIFHPINLKTVPDEVGINSLEVRPYLHTAIGNKQHVSIPIFCDRCDDDVKEELWQCDIAVCRMGVCRQCADDMEHEWQERIGDAWNR